MLVLKAQLMGRQQDLENKQTVAFNILLWAAVLQGNLDPLAVKE